MRLVHPAGSSVGYPASGSAFVARTQGAPIVQLSGRPRTRPRAARRRREAAELAAGCTSADEAHSELVSPVTAVVGSCATCASLVSEFTILGPGTQHQPDLLKSRF